MGPQDAGNVRPLGSPPQPKTKTNMEISPELGFPNEWPILLPSVIPNLVLFPSLAKLLERR